MNFLEKIQNLPIGKRKLILWMIMIIIGAGLLFLYTKNIKQRLQGFNKEELQKGLKLPELQEELKKLPKFEMSQAETPQTEMPEVPQKELKE